MKGYYERTKKKKPVDRAGALIYGRFWVFTEDNLHIMVVGCPVRSYPAPLHLI